ncbi:MAG: transposase, partial [Pseudomonadota bacterium]
MAAITLLAGIGDFHRFANPRQLIAYPGLTPGERSSLAKTLRGAIAKAGNTRERRVLAEPRPIACRRGSEPRSS